MTGGQRWATRHTIDTVVVIVIRVLIPIILLLDLINKVRKLVHIDLKLLNEVQLIEERPGDAVLFLAVDGVDAVPPRIQHLILLLMSPEKLLVGLQIEHQASPERLFALLWESRQKRYLGRFDSNL